MSTVTTTNGRPPRKQLADQIDRLDQLLDGLADGLNEAIADACREGTRQAVREAVVEVLSNPELRAVVGGTTAAVTPADPIPPRPSFWVQLKAKLAAARAAVTASVTPVVAEVSGRCRAATAAVASAVQTLGSAWQWKRIMLIGLGVGAATAAVAYLAPHALSATLAGVGATVTAVAIQAVAWLRRSARHTLGLA